VLTDTHFAERDRLGRLTGFLARLRADRWSKVPLGLGVDPATALCVDRDGVGRVVGRGEVHVVRVRGAVCRRGQPLAAVKREHRVLQAGDRIHLPKGRVEAAERSSE
jgi:cyanophycinase-like exopeptidase